ncbi:MAG: permease [Micavibrio sp.]|nr:MAG: permease [Micavibrio sp.]
MTEKTPHPHQDQVILGVIHGLLAFFLLAIMSVCSKLLSETHHVAEVVFYRNIIAFIPLAIYIAATRKTHILKTAKPLMMFGRVIVGTIGLLLTFAAWQYLPLSDATVIFFTATLLAPALSFFFLKEHVGIYRWAAILIGFFGVILMAAPSGETKIIGIMIAFAAAFMHAWIHLFLRILKTESPLTVTFYFFLGGFLIPGLFLPFIARMPQPDEWLLFLGLGISGGVAQYYLTSAFQKGPIAIIAPLNYTGLIWATGFDILIWNYVPGWPVFLGGAIIISSNLFIIYREQKLKSSSRIEQASQNKKEETS